MNYTQLLSTLCSNNAKYKRTTKLIISFVKKKETKGDMSQKKKQIVYAFPMQSGIAAICNVRTVYFNLILYVLQDAH